MVKAKSLLYVIFTLVLAFTILADEESRIIIGDSEGYYSTGDQEMNAFWVVPNHEIPLFGGTESRGGGGGGSSPGCLLYPKIINLSIQKDTWVRHIVPINNTCSEIVTLNVSCSGTFCSKVKFNASGIIKERSTFNITLDVTTNLSRGSYLVLLRLRERELMELRVETSKNPELPEPNLPLTIFEPTAFNLSFSPDIPFWIYPLSFLSAFGMAILGFKKNKVETTKSVILAAFIAGLLTFVLWLILALL